MRKTSFIMVCLCLSAPGAARAQESEPASVEGETVPARAPEAQTEETPTEAAQPVPDVSASVGPDVEENLDEFGEGLEEEIRPAAETVEMEGPEREELPEPHQEIFLHGFRLGYLYVNGIEALLDSRDPDGLRYWERYDMRAPHLFMIGYEATLRMIGYDWLNVIVTANILIAGLEQSRFFPSLNLILGAEISQLAQIGIGISLTPTKEQPAHMLIAAGFTPRVGSFYVPLHAFFVPDMDGHHKFGMTVGVNFF